MKEVATRGEGGGTEVKPALLVILLGSLLAAGLGKELWYDEAYTVLSYVIPGPWHALTSYRVPNNHMLYSVLLGLLPKGIEPLYRLVSVLASVGTLFLVIRSTRRLVSGASRASTTSAVMAVAIALPVFISFSTQIRGYAISMFLAAAASDLLLGRIERQTMSSGILYGLAGAALIATIPSNGVFLGCLALTDLWHALRGHSAHLITLARRLWPHAIALSGAFFYLAVGDQLLAALRHGWGARSALGLVASLLAAGLPGLLLLPAIVGTTRATPAGLDPRFRDFMLPLVVAFAGTILLLSLLSVHLFARSFLPFLPLAMAASAAWALRGTDERRLRTAILVTACCGLALWLGAAHWLLKDGGRHPAHVRIPLYFEAADFDPSAPLALLERLPPQTAMVAYNHEESVRDTFALYYKTVLAGAQSRFYYSSRVAGRGCELLRAHRSLILVSRFAHDLEPLCAQLDLDPRLAHPLKAHGFYKVWQLPRPPSEPERKQRGSD